MKIFKKVFKNLLTIIKYCDIIYMLRCWCGSMAEQLICNQQVVGSTPITSSKWALTAGSPYGGFPERPKGADCKSVVTDFGGPNPPSPTKNPRTTVRGFFFFLFSFPYARMLEKIVKRWRKVEFFLVCIQKIKKTTASVLYPLYTPRVHKCWGSFFGKSIRLQIMIYFFIQWEKIERFPPHFESLLSAACSWCGES